MNSILRQDTCELTSSIESITLDDDIERTMTKSLEAGRIVPPKKHERSRRRITAHIQNSDFEVIFEKASEGITMMRNSYETMFQIWKSESELNTELEKEIAKVKSFLEAQTKMTKAAMNEKCELREEIERLQRNSQTQEKRVEELESENRALKCQMKEIKHDASNKEQALQNQEDELKTYRCKTDLWENKIGRLSGEFRARSNAIKRVHSTPHKQNIFKQK